MPKNKDKKSETKTTTTDKKSIVGGLQSLREKDGKFNEKAEKLKNKAKEEHKKVTQTVTGVKDGFTNVVKGIEKGIDEITTVGMKDLEKHGKNVVQGVKKFSKVGVEGVVDVLQGGDPLKNLQNLANFKENELQTLWRHAMDNFSKGNPIDMLNDLATDIVPVFNKLGELISTFDKDVMGSFGKETLSKMNGGLDKMAQGISSFMDSSEGNGVAKTIENAMQSLFNVVQNLMQSVTQLLGIGKAPTVKPF